MPFTQPHHLELLAPARTADIGMEAVKHGADAVYIGGPGFGARAQAANTVADIARLVEYAHAFRAKIFVALNTILRDEELEPARALIWQLHDAGVDALIVQDMGLLELDLPPIPLHASTQCDIRTPEKAKFLQDVGFTQLVLARELTLEEIADIHAVLDPDRSVMEFFVHGALCVAYSGQCYVSHANTGRSANRGDCSQACRLPYTVQDRQGRIVAYEKHVLSVKDNNQSGNLRALVEAGVRSFKIEGRYKDKAYVKNITAHYRQLLDDVLRQRPDLTRSSQGLSTFSFVPEPAQNFNRQSTDYFVQGRQMDIAALDTPKHSGIPLGWVHALHADSVDVITDKPLHNGDGLTWFDLQGTLMGMVANRVQALPAPHDDQALERETGQQLWRIFPKNPVLSHRDLRKGTILQRNRDMQWLRTLERESAQRSLGLRMTLEETQEGFALSVTDEDNHEARIPIAHEKVLSSNDRHTLAATLDRLGGSGFHAEHIAVPSQPWFIPSSKLHAARRQALEALRHLRLQHVSRLAPGVPTVPAASYPQDTLSYLANVYNHAAQRFYLRHGVQVVEPAYENHAQTGEVSLMITRHCVRYTLSLCPKQAKGVVGVQGTVRAEPLQLINGKEKMNLRFDCKRCEMHVMGSLKPQVLRQQAKAQATAPVHFYPRPEHGRGKPFAKEDNLQIQRAGSKT